MASKLDLPPAQERRDFAEFSIAAVAGLALALTILFICAVPLAGNLAASRDFVSYWVTGQQLVHHGNPYDRNAIAALEHSAGLTVKAVLIMRNPPWALPLAYPLGFLGLRFAAILWTLLLLACLLISVRMVRGLHGSPPNRIHWLGFAFTPALICLIMGQTSLFALLGLALFLHFYRSRPFAAGAALWLCALKPQLFVPFSVVLLAWVLITRRYKIVAGAAVAVENEFIPCLSDAFRFWLRPQAVWLQYLPATLGCVWALIYFWRRRRGWDWAQNGSLLMLVSLLTAPYCWFYDQGVAIPALLEGAYVTRSRKLLVVLALTILGTDIELCAVRVTSPLYLWTAPAWLAWYLFARASAASPAARPPQDNT